MLVQLNDLLLQCKFKVLRVLGFLIPAQLPQLWHFLNFEKFARTKVTGYVKLIDSLG